MRKKFFRLLVYSQIDTFIDDDLKKGLQNSRNNRQLHNNTIEDDWDKVQTTVSAHLDDVSLLLVVLKKPLLLLTIYHSFSS